MIGRNFGRTVGPWLCGFLVLIGVSQSWGGKVQEPPKPVPLPNLRGVILTKEDAFVVLRPEMVASGDVESVSASPNGTYLLVEQRHAPPRRFLDKSSPDPEEHSLFLWDTLERRGVTLPREKLLKICGG
ncbi:MAG: hypothetical protein OHK0029_08310 [Armatimonadaceae bacterium]